MAHRNVRGLATAAATLLLATAVPRAADAQIGLMAGANFETLSDLQGSGSFGQAFQASTGYHVGLFVNVGAGPVALRPALLYLNAGSLFEGASFLTGSSFDLNYLALPIDVIVRPAPLIYLLAGPELQLLVAANAQPAFENALKTFSARGGIGMGLKFGRAFMEGRYLFGLSNITSDTYTVGTFTVTGADQVSNAVRVSLGLAF